MRSTITGEVAIQPFLLLCRDLQTEEKRPIVFAAVEVAGHEPRCLRGAVDLPKDRGVGPKKAGVVSPRKPHVDGNGHGHKYPERTEKDGDGKGDERPAQRRR